MMGVGRTASISAFSRLKPSTFKKTAFQQASVCKSLPASPAVSPESAPGAIASLYAQVASVVNQGNKLWQRNNHKAAEANALALREQAELRQLINRFFASRPGKAPVSSTHSS